MKRNMAPAEEQASEEERDRIQAEHAIPADAATFTEVSRASAWTRYARLAFLIPAVLYVLFAFVVPIVYNLILSFERTSPATISSLFAPFAGAERIAVERVDKRTWRLRPHGRPVRVRYTGREPAGQPALLTFEEEIRPEAEATIGGLRARGIDVKIVSGDDPITVQAITGEPR